MKLPDKCPNCGKPNYWLQRGEPDFDKEEPDRVADEIFECSECHTLFRARWKLISWNKLFEVATDE